MLVDSCSFTTAIAEFAENIRHFCSAVSKEIDLRSTPGSRALAVKDMMHCTEEYTKNYSLSYDHSPRFFELEFDKLRRLFIAFFHSMNKTERNAYPDNTSSLASPSAGLVRPNHRMCVEVRFVVDTSCTTCNDTVAEGKR